VGFSQGGRFSCESHDLHFLGNGGVYKFVKVLQIMRINDVYKV
jgi:hypothetical protein